MATRKAHSRTTFVGGLVVLALALAVVPAALAGKGGNGGGKAGTSGGGAYTGTLSGPVMVVDKNNDGVPNSGDQITFNVTSNAAYPFVQVTCSQSGSPVLQQTLGFFGSWMRSYYLGGLAWTGGAADCAAVLYSQDADGTMQPSEARLSFHVNA
jgi:hypothetical protein